MWINWLTALLSSRIFLRTPTPTPTLKVNVVLANDDGWAEANIRALYDALNFPSSGSRTDVEGPEVEYSVVLSAPAENKSGSGSTDLPPQPRKTPCQFNSCPAGSPAVGFNETDPRLNYVNSFPVTAMKYGIQNLSLQLSGGPPDIALSGPNVGSNTGLVTLISGTVGAATEAAIEGVPAIAFSGRSGDQVSYASPLETYMINYALLARNLTTTLIIGADGNGTKPYLPPNVFLNVNFPSSSDTECSDIEEFKFTLTRINPLIFGQDVEFCGSSRLKLEDSVIRSDGCWVSVSVGNARTKGDVDADTQAFVLERLGKLLTCI